MPLVHSLHAKRARRARFFVSAAGLEAGAWLLQKFGLLRCAGATKYGVAVGEAAKAFDDHLMAAGKIGEALEGGLRRAAGLPACSAASASNRVTLRTCCSRDSACSSGR